MATVQDDLVPANDFCMYHEVEYTFITSLHAAGLVEVCFENEGTFIPAKELQKLEKLIRLHNDLEINIAGIEAITHLLDRIEHLQEDMRRLNNRQGSL